MPLDELPGTFFGPPNLVDLVRHRARHQPDDVAFTYLIDGENEQVHLTNRELDRQARAIGAWLESQGLVGGRALLLYPPGLEFVAAFFGCLYAGVVAVPVYPPRRNRSLDRIQAVSDDAEAKVALTTDVVLKRVEPLIDSTPHLRDLTWLATCHVPEGMEEKWEMPDVHSDTMAFLQYTSGSTGTPKGVMLNHANLLHNSALIAHAFEHTRSGLGVFWLPSYHDMGLIGGILQPLYVGRPNILMSPMAFLQKPYRWLSAITRFGGTTSGGPNFAYELCVRKVTPEQREKLDLSTWEVAFNGAEPVRKETLDRFAEMFEPCGFRREAFYPCYGLAEATLIVSGGYAMNSPTVRAFEAAPLAEGTADPPSDSQNGARLLVGCGETLPDQEIAIADPDTKVSCPQGKVGEIWVRGPSVAQGYWRRAQATVESFQAHLSDTGKGPFLRTGDLGFLQDGELFVTGRIKDLIIQHGVNVYPQDVELTVQQSHDRLNPDSGAAFAVETGGREQIVVVQEVARRTKGELAEVFAAIRRAVSREHDIALDAIVLVKAGSIPKTSSGKIQRHACRDGYLAGTLTVVGQWSAEPVSAPPNGDGRQTDRSVVPAVKKPSPPEPSALASGGRSGAPFAEDESSGGDANPDEKGQPGKGKTAPHSPPQSDRPVADSKNGNGSGNGKKPKLVEAAVPPEYYQFDRFPEYVQLKEKLTLSESTGLGGPSFPVHEGVTNDTTVIDGREFISFSSFNYLGMSGDPVVVEAAQHAAERYGTSVSSSRVVSGEKDLHGDLERAIARFLGTEDAVVLTGGHATNETVIGHLLGPDDLVLCDAAAHDSILQGALLSRACRESFPHNSWESVDSRLKPCRGDHRRVLIVIEGIYSMDGDVPDLPRFIEVKKRHKALLMVDEAQSIGVLGEGGRGLGEHFGVDRRDVEVWMGTLSKALGSCGGYIAGSKQLVEYLKHTAPGFVHSAGMPPPNAAAALASIHLLEAEPHRVSRLRDRVRRFVRLAKKHGLNTGGNQDSPVVPVILGNSLHCHQLAKALFARRINVQPVLYPAVEENRSRLRFFLTSLHTDKQIDRTIEAMVEELERINPRYLAHASLG